MVGTSANTAPKTSMIFKIQPLAAQLYRVLLITVVFSFLKPSEVHDSLHVLLRENPKSETPEHETRIFWKKS